MVVVHMVNGFRRKARIRTGPVRHGLARRRPATPHVLGLCLFPGLPVSPEQLPYHRQLLGLQLWRHPADFCLKFTTVNQ
jgi:hypothetical protein